MYGLYLANLQTMLSNAVPHTACDFDLDKSTNRRVPEFGTHFAPKNATRMVIIGNGAQAEFQALAFKAFLDIGELTLYDIDPAAIEKCFRNLADHGFQMRVASSAEDAVQGAQVVTTVTADKQYASVLTDNMIGSSVHINAIGGDCPGKTELHRDILLRSKIFVEFAPQT